MNLFDFLDSAFRTACKAYCCAMRAKYAIKTKAPYIASEKELEDMCFGC